jgi:hypothetical protein
VVINAKELGLGGIRTGWLEVEDWRFCGGGRCGAGLNALRRAFPVRMEADSVKSECLTGELAGIPGARPNETWVRVQ